MPHRTRNLILAAGVLGVLALLARPLAAAELTEGKDYRTLTPPQPGGNPGKIEVIEFFSYGCPHCSEFYPLVSAWVARLPKDVAFKRVAVGFGRPAWVNLARAYYALESTGDLAKLDGAVFHAIHAEHQPLFDEESIARWVGAHGGNAAQFANAYTSFSVNNETYQADEMAETYRVEAIPTLAVNGKYVVIGNSFAELLDHADKLIARVRAESPGGAAAAKTR
ncbi:MAG TPA: thiol:disulfide interchange protein DsbA/DsbL [Steroidobacteraceae bacterium]|jgi:thiol:disulfide interchange protein DsbA|nr:thiol:disulfide interchange protein DsbA/DsbL [Steroidobacteraceae bacterium]